MPPLVSVVIPVFNAATYLRQCLSSALGQTYTNIELVCVNDGSSDGSLKILKEFALTHSNIIVASQENSGVSCARNAGLLLARGDLIVFVDADDYIDGDLIASYVGGFSNAADLLVSGPRSLIGDYPLSALTELIYHGLRFEWLNSPCGKLYRREVIVVNGLEFDTSTSLGEDLLFNIQYMLHSRGVVVVCEDMYHVRLTTGSLTRSYRPTKYQEVSYTNHKLREMLEPFRSSRMESLLNYKRIKNLISCMNGLYCGASDVSPADAALQARVVIRENPRLLVPVGDLQMRLIGFMFNHAGLAMTSRVVCCGNALRRSVNVLRTRIAGVSTNRCRP